MFVSSNGRKYQDAYGRTVHSYAHTAQFVCSNGRVVTTRHMFSHVMSIMVQTIDFYCQKY